MQLVLWAVVQTQIVKNAFRTFCSETLLMLWSNDQHFKTAFVYSKFILCHIKPNIYKSKTKFASHKQYLFCLLTSTNIKKTQTDQSIPTVFLLSEKKRPTNLSKWQLQLTRFCSVYVISTTCFDAYFSFYVITGWRYFWWKFIVTLRFF